MTRPDSDRGSRGPASEDVAVARKVLLGPSAVIGFVAAKPLTDTWPTLLRLARAINLLTSATVGIIRASDDVAPENRPAADAPIPYRVQEIEPGRQLAEITLPATLGIGEAVQGLERAIGHARAHFAHVIIDLGGYLPDAREVLELPDAFVSAAIAGRTREVELRAAVEMLPTSRHLGTLLVD